MDNKSKVTPLFTTVLPIRSVGLKTGGIPQGWCCEPVAVNPHQLPVTVAFNAEHGGTCQHGEILLHTDMKAGPFKQRKTPDSINYWVEKGEGSARVSRLVCCQTGDGGNKRMQRRTEKRGKKKA